ncbi:MAG: UbiA family prenyltransferase [Planctomycetes bacterium]|nr:UbiA family prenyltransferase [Planctomycetota bacterium]
MRTPTRPGALLRLFRFSIAFTPLADIAAGFATGSLLQDPLPSSPGIKSIYAVLASVAVFCSAVSLNDLLDRKKDLRLSPDRPIPSGAISVPAALIGSVLMALAGLCLATLIGRRTFAAVGVVLFLTVLYNLFTRRNDALGILNLAMIRVADFLVGMTLLDVPISSLWSGHQKSIFLPGILMILYGLYAGLLSFIALGERSQKKIGLIFPILMITALSLVPVAMSGAQGGILPAFILWVVLVLPMIRFLQTPQRKTEEIVGHLVSGYFLIAALIVLATERPLLCAVLWIAYFISRFLSKRFPPT